MTLLCVLSLGACRAPEDPEPAEPAAPTPPAEVTLADFQGLRWLEGQWRGTGGGVDPFYEGYRFLNDSTIRAEFYSDSTLSVVADSSVISVSQGVLTSRGENSVSTATEIDSNHVRFESPEQGRSFTWTRESESEWRAHLTMTIFGEVREIDYRLVRIGDFGR